MLAQLCRNCHQINWRQLLTRTTEGLVAVLVVDVITTWIVWSISKSTTLSAAVGGFAAGVMLTFSTTKKH
ncbi:hypothetical protein COT78_01745 [Candidatus Berkelbacteria bacterium CG10_big_fil_rev_8_21_14_0_10_43_13]|uniref:Uncharacterized protein n=1 Tax=Candidatus Berkelbacteria bacterium CG10_big_fil_rev_8_21_14_0_10_43_13 TaxID=1974514 RepID=A0A2H0W6T7_9BACT|nr:MAG: hypothetical protein COT78_01745 [Candidatus Berkelbacteria bacterium CG10_big_fil_rev_8_21_14_0_10_43_13]